MTAEQSGTDAGQHVVASPVDLDLVELATDAGQIEVRAHEAPLVLLDSERTPVAELDRTGSAWALTRMRPLAARPELPLAGVLAATSGAVAACAAAVLFDALPTRAQIAAVDALRVDGGVAWVALVGRCRADGTAGALLGAVLAAAAAWSARTGRVAPVVALPWTLTRSATPGVLLVPDQLRTADGLAGWFSRVSGVSEALVFGAGEEHAALASLEGDAAGAARALFPSEVLPFHTGAQRSGTVLLLTGLSGSGKSTLANALAARLPAGSTALLDGDDVRQVLSTELGFDAAGRALNIRRIGWVAARIGQVGGTAIAAPIAPFAAGRAEMRRMAEAVGARFVLVHVATSLAVCEQRDRKGLYAAARAGRITDFTGISSPYEAPTDADLVLDTETVAVEAAVDRLIALLTAERRG